MKDYCVENLKDNTYQVMDNRNDVPFPQVFFQGSLADCEAWIRLHENGYM